MIGHCFEDFVCMGVKHLPGIRRATKVEDRFQGADLYWHGLPIDVTLNQEKSCTEWSYLVQDFSYFRVQVGIRRGNGAATFEQPVLVLKVESFMDLSYDSGMDAVVGEVAKEFESLLEWASDWYWEKEEEGLTA